VVLFGDADPRFLRQNTLSHAQLLQKSRPDKKIRSDEVVVILHESIHQIHSVLAMRTSGMWTRMAINEPQTSASMPEVRQSPVE